MQAMFTIFLLTGPFAYPSTFRTLRKMAASMVRWLHMAPVVRY
jgi:hypothetical protein